MQVLPVDGSVLQLFHYLQVMKAGGNKTLILLNYIYNCKLRIHDFKVASNNLTMDVKEI